MKENQNIEFKESWRDEYLKWICGFANAQGGKMYIGVRDNGEVCGVADAKRLMEDIPNKVKDVLGIIVDVNQLKGGDLDYIEIEVASYPYPISYKGHYYSRSGATNQELKGAALDRYMMRTLGKTWDGVPVPYLYVEDLDNATFDLFRKYAKRSGRMTEADLQDDNKGLLDKLRLFEGTYLKRATALTFHPDPEKFVTGAFVKIGYFRGTVDLIYQDEVHGNLFQQVKQTLDILTTKYLRALISYEGIQRVESLPMPRESLREALLNSVVHKSYESNSPIQIAVFDDRLEIYNSAVLPEDWTIEDLLTSHRSRPYNPDVANVFFRTGEIESWGRGIQRIIEACQDEGCPTPTFEYRAGGIWTTFHFGEEYVAAFSNIKSGGKQITELGKERDGKDDVRFEIKIDSIIKGISIDVREKLVQVMSALNDSPGQRTTAIETATGIPVKSLERYVKILRDNGLVEYRGPNKTGGYYLTLRALEE